MRVEINGQTLELHQGDISRQQVDAIVNAANSRLAGGGGVDGAIHRRGGAAIMAETAAKYPDGCPTGSAVISTAGNLAGQVRDPCGRAGVERRASRRGRTALRRLRPRAGVGGGRRLPQRRPARLEHRGLPLSHGPGGADRLEHGRGFSPPAWRDRSWSASCSSMPALCGAFAAALEELGPSASGDRTNSAPRPQA